MKKILFFISYLLLVPVSSVSAQVDLQQQYPFGRITSLSEGIGYLITPAFTVAGLAILFYFIWGAFKLTFSGGDKAAVGEARGMIVHAIIGLLLLIFMFVIFQFIPEFFGFNFRVISLPGGR